MTATIGTDLDTSLSTMMREGSQAEHTEAETSSFMSTLLAGGVNAVGYSRYLVMLRQVYVALEDVAARLADDSIAGPLVDRDLDRLATIDADLRHWAPSGAPEVESAAASAYAERILESASWGGAYVAHHYTRYLGDLSGGQAIGRILAREFELDGAGVDFYIFEAIPKPKPYKDNYRATLDTLPLTAEEKQRVVDEVKVAFNLNGALFAELTAEIEAYRR